MIRRMGIVFALVVMFAGSPAGSLSLSAKVPDESPDAAIPSGDDSAPLVVQLGLETKSPGRTMRLRDVVEVRADRDGTWESVGDVLVRVHEGRFIRRVDIARRLRRAGLDESAFRVTGPALCDWRPRASFGDGR